MSRLRSFYLECRNETSQKFYRGIQKGRYLLGHHGRLGTVGQFKLWSFSYEGAALAAWRQKCDEKSDRGYVGAPDPLDESAQLRLFMTALAEEPYEFFWKTSEQHPVRPEHIAQAAHETTEVLEMIPGAAVSIQLEDDGRRVRLKAGPDEAHFGYPPDEVLAAWTAEDLRQAVNISRDGWLAADGSGQGVITTRRDWIDLPVRVFLSRMAKHGRIAVIDTFDNALSETPVLPNLGVPFAWEKMAPALRDAVTTLGWMPGVVSTTQEVVLETTGHSVTLVTW